WSPEDTREEEWHEWRLATLLPLRADLIAGDWRCLYLAWLSAVQGYDVDRETPEPPIPPGMRRLSGALAELAEFLYVDEDLIAIAAEASAKAPPGPSADHMAAWISGIPEEKKNEWVLRVMQDKAGGLSGELITDFRRANKPKNVS